MDGGQSGEKGATKTLGKDDVPEGATIFLKNCHDANYVISATSTKVLVGTAAHMSWCVANVTVLTDSLFFAQRDATTA